MYLSLNSVQAKRLSGFFFDVAKGLLLGGVGSVFISPEARLIAVSLATLSSLGCVKIGLMLLEDIEL